MKLDIDRLTLGEIATLEDLSNMPLQHIADAADRPQGKLLAALCYVQARRQGEPRTWKECLDQTADEASAFLGLGEDDDEDQAADLEDDQADDDGTGALEDEDDTATFRDDGTPG